MKKTTKKTDNDEIDKTINSLDKAANIQGIILIVGIIVILVVLVGKCGG